MTWKPSWTVAPQSHLGCSTLKWQNEIFSISIYCVWPLSVVKSHRPPASPLSRPCLLCRTWSHNVYPHGSCCKLLPVSPLLNNLHFSQRRGVSWKHCGVIYVILCPLYFYKLHLKEDSWWCKNMLFTNMWSDQTDGRVSYVKMDKDSAGSHFCQESNPPPQEKTPHQ